MLPSLSRICGFLFLFPSSSFPLCHFTHASPGTEVGRDGNGDLDLPLGDRCSWLLVTHLHSLSHSPAASAPRSTSRRLSAGYLAPRTNHGPNFPPPDDFCSSDSVPVHVPVGWDAFCFSSDPFDLLLYFPIGLDEHWFSFVVCIKDKAFVFLDSAYGSYHRDIRDDLGGNAK
ncbi:uncharacterized protein LOC119354390 isoform X1 [Triticum dicoccoides]|uniref:uncharacterized protein LOC119354390 isoform X1 n=1 Tax=Triticum dicoccoides TaxID=85692 RepID=UPI0018903EFC|nr:uncharacterized protein LOC119354390 isoform X1 [Triticum dicoccoides]